MAARICPPWKGYLLLNPLRKLLENPNKILGQFVQEGMTVLEPGCGMGYFTLTLARLVGPEGRVVAVDIQPKMLSTLERRARKAGLLSRIEIRQARADMLDVEDLTGEVDFAGALHLVHEVPNQSTFFAEIWETLKPGSKLLIIEPKGHVSQDQFEQSVAAAESIGLRPDFLFTRMGARVAVLTKPDTLQDVSRAKTK